MPDEVKIKYPILDHIEVPEQTLKSWQITVDLLAKIANIPAALIMRVHEKEIEVFVSSHSEGNVYYQGEKAPLDFGLYCETVMNTQRELIVPNALKDPLWDKNPDIKLGMISYCGLPLTWPGGKIFGTICILDHQENAYLPEIRGLLEQFRDSVQFSLETIYNSSVERNQAKEVAKEQYSTLRSALDSTDAHIFSLDRQYRYTSFNKGHVAVMKAIYGAEIEIGRSLFDYQTVPEDREKAKRNIDRALAGEKFIEAAYSGEEKLTRLYFEISHNPVVAEDGAVIGVVVFSQDITVRKQTEDELHRNIFLSEQSRKAMLSILEDQKRSEDLIRKSEEKYRTLLQTAIDGFWLTDGKGKLLQVNESYCRMSGYTEQELLTMHIKDLDSVETADANAAHIKRITTKGEDRFETKHRKKDGSLFDVEANVQYKDTDGGRFIVFLQDITERKLAEKELRMSEERLKVAQHMSHTGNWELDLVKNKLVWSDEIYRIFEIVPAKFEASYEAFLNAIHPDDREAVDRAYTSSLKTRSPYEIDHRLLMPDGRIKYVHESCETFYDNQGSSLRSVGTVQDITERKQAEIALHESKELLVYAFNKSPLMITQSDVLTGKYLEVNDSFCSTSEFSREEIIGKSAIELGWISEDNRMGMMQKVQQDGWAKGMELTLRSKNGKNIIGRYWGTVIHTAQGDRLFSTAEDITERKQTEEALAASRKMLNDILDNTRIHLWAFNGTQYIYTNKEWFNFTGQDPNFSLTIERWVSAVHPDDQAPSGEIWIKNWETKTEHDNYFRLRRYDGVYRDFYCHAVPIYDNEGKFQYFQGFNFDITERKQAEVALRRSEAIKSKMVSNIGDVIVIIDQNGINQYKSRNITKLFGWQPEELVGKSTWDIVHADDLEAAKKFIGSLSAKPNAAGTTEIRYKRKDGNYVWIEITVLNLLSDPDIQGFLGNYHDISDRKQIEFELIKAKDKAEESDRLKTAFLCNMSHEIRTPMNGILGFSSLLSEPGLESEEQQEYIKLIHKCGDRMLNIISEIMDISKIESGLTEIRIKEVNITKQLESVYKLLKPDAEVKAINLFIKDSLPMDDVIIMTDGEKLFGILSNLVKNAIKYTDKGSVEFGYGSTISPTKLNEIQFYVKDTGIGIPKDRQQAIFDRFIQADIADIEARQGAGLGLSIATAYVEMLGGKIWVESEQGKGSCFYFTIPYCVEPEEKNVAAKVVQQESFENHIYPEVLALKILIAEDDEVSKTLFYKNLKPFSKQIIVTTTGLGTIEACRNTKDIDLILMDIRMPNLNGYEATRQIRQFNKDVVIIAQTSFGLSGDREKAIEAGCNDYIAKPIDKDELLALIHKYFVR